MAFSHDISVCFELLFLFSFAPYGENLNTFFFLRRRLYKLSLSQTICVGGNFRLLSGKGIWKAEKLRRLTDISAKLASPVISLKGSMIKGYIEEFALDLGTQS